MTKIIGERLRKLRMDNRYSQAQIADMCVSTQANIGRYEQGLVDVSLDKLLRYAETFELSLD